MCLKAYDNFYFKRHEKGRFVEFLSRNTGILRRVVPGRCGGGVRIMKHGLDRCLLGQNMIFDRFDHFSRKRHYPTFTPDHDQGVEKSTFWGQKVDLTKIAGNGPQMVENDAGDSNRPKSSHFCTLDHPQSPH